MAYTALYRKLRPGTFDGVIGQDHIIRTLTNQLNTGRVSHAYLFCGTRGTGKTSTAKVFAKAVNCSAPVNGEPCGSCEMCAAIETGASMNVIEIDAASNNGVDNIRDIREEVKYPPTFGQYKVYIIDEVHMLSAGAFNALLKTLEEPPEHVVFILATTDPQKIPATILSRCQRFDFRRISSAAMAETMRKYMQDENVTVSDEALQYIARVSDGAMRDALSILDQCISYYFDEEITLDKVLDITGSVDNSVFFAMADALLTHNAEQCMALIDDAAMRGRDLNRFTTELLTHMRNLLVALSAAGSDTALDASAENRAAYAQQAARASADRWIAYIHSFSELLARMKYAPNDRMLLEIACIQLCSAQAAPAQSSGAAAVDSALMARLDKLERDMRQNAERPAPAASAPAKEVKPEAPVAHVKKAMPDDVKRVCKDWRTFAASFPLPEGSFLAGTDVGYLNNANLYIVCGTTGIASILKKKDSMFREKLREAYGADFQLQYITRGEYDMEHKRLFGKKDDFTVEDEIDALKQGLHADITVE